MFNYDIAHIKSKKELENEITEYEAYISLAKETGNVDELMSFTAHLEKLKNNYKTFEPNKNKQTKNHKIPVHPYYKEKRKRRRLKKMYESGCVSYRMAKMDGFYKIYTLSPTSTHLKRISNKKMRKYKKGVKMEGSNYKRIFDYWWIIY